MNVHRRRLLGVLTGALFALGAMPALAQHKQTVVVYKSPTCGCCSGWVDHMRANGFKIESHDVADVDPIKRKLGIGGQFASCHTATVGGYAIEGHVPAADIRRLLTERPKAVGLAAPGMPVGSPGMPGNPQPYDVLLLTSDGGSRLWKRHP
jgi:hypothetical protein